MKHNLLKLSVQTLNSIFSHITCNKRQVLWLRTPDYKQQLYVGKEYEHIWKRSCAELYDHPDSWKDYLVDNTNNNTMVKLMERTDDDNTRYYTIFLDNGEKQLIKDTSFFLKDGDGKDIAVGGVASVIRSPQPEENARDVNVLQRVLDIANHELKLNPNNKPKKLPRRKYELQLADRSVPLTRCEAQCLYYLIQGLSIKKIANLKFRSSRTIETHVANIKDKLGCSTRAEVMFHIGNFDQVKHWF